MKKRNQCCVFKVRQYTYILYCKSLAYAYFVPLPHSAMGWNAVCNYGISWPLFIIFKLLELSMTTPLYYIRLNYQSAPG